MTRPNTKATARDDEIARLDRDIAKYETMIAALHKRRYELDARRRKLIDEAATETEPTLYAP